MRIIPTLILWSIAWSPPVGLDDQHAPGAQPGAALRRVERGIASPVTLKPADSSSADVPSLADLGTTPAEEDDGFGDDASDFGPFPRWADSHHAVAVIHLPPPGDRAHAFDRSFPVRC